MFIYLFSPDISYGIFTIDILYDTLTGETWGGYWV